MINHRSSGTILVTFWSARDAKNTANPLRRSSFSCISSLLLQMPSWTKKIIQKAPGETLKRPQRLPRGAQEGSGAPWGPPWRPPAPSPESSKRALGPPRGLRECFRRYLGLMFELWRPLFLSISSHKPSSRIHHQTTIITHRSSLITRQPSQ